MTKVLFIRNKSIESKIAQNQNKNEIEQYKINYKLKNIKITRNKISIHSEIFNDNWMNNGHNL